jgi:hypothetical protein
MALTWDFLSGKTLLWGPKQTFLASAGSISVGLAIAARYAIQRDFAAAVQFGTIIVQMSLLYLLFSSYELESPVYHNLVFPIVATGFVANHFLPAELRGQFFLLLSIATMFAIFGVSDGLLMLGIGLSLIAVCHLPIHVWWRAALLLIAVAVIGCFRAGVISSPSLIAILPIFASIFMFRLVIYLYDLHTKNEVVSPSLRLSYFFMLPNFAFPFFPVVDFSGWVRAFQAHPSAETYQRGVYWLTVGAIHLLLYRLVNYYLTIDPSDVTGFWSFLYYAVTNFGLYLKVSGLFHMILGCLFMFGFALPETHTRYYLSHSFIEFWRRINIYWKDFMQKMVFNPVFAWVKSRGTSHMQAILAAIAAVFFVTWALHAYQWFWLLGTLLFTVPDVLFWLLLGLLLMVQTVEESRPPKPNAVAMIGPGTLLALRTVATMLTIVILWSLWSSETLGEWLALVTVAGLPLIDPSAPWSPVNVATSMAFLFFLFIIFGLAMGYTFGLAPRGSHARKRIGASGKPKEPSQLVLAAQGSALVGALLLVQHPQFVGALPARTGNFVLDMGVARLSDRDQAQLERGYYENLTNSRMINSELWNYGQDAENWLGLKFTNVVQPVSDYRKIVLRPNAAIQFKRGYLSTNSMGMRDREYSETKAPGVVRIGLVGSSRAFGDGVNNDEIFENILEDRWNARAESPVEILNFSVSGYDAIQKLMVLEQDTLPRSMDAVIFVAHWRDIAGISDREDLAQRLADGGLPFEFMEPPLKSAGLAPDMPRREITRRLKTVADEMVREAYLQFAQKVRAAGALPIWVYLPSTVDHLSAPDDAVLLRGFAMEAGFEIIDLWDIYAGINVEELWIAPKVDDHPNGRGHRLIADRLERELLQLPEFQELVQFGPDT